MIKRAYIIARQKEEYQALARRIRAIFFLATPHRGADLAQVLSRILNVSPGARTFVKDLHRNSLATQSINEEFPQYSQDLRLYSFYETLPMAFGLGKSLVVEKDMAVLGYPNEQSRYLNANHREVCKFADRTDPNYQIVRNSLASTIDILRNSAIHSRYEVNIDQRRQVDSYLGVSDAPEDDFLDIDSLRLHGSCEWLIQKRSFAEWRDSANMQLYWISAKPAMGKTVLIGKVIHHLRDLGRDTAFFFFDYRNKAQTTIGSFLLSMAAQMAYMHTEVLQTVLNICERENQLREADYRTIWRKLFVGGILRTSFSRPQYWVLDALDECKAGSDLVPLFLKMIDMHCNIRILLTSRDRFESHRQATNSKNAVLSEEIMELDTKSDIALYLEANLDQLPSISEEDKRDMVAKILDKSAGCFLWVSLILQELRRAHTSTEIRQVLEDVPSDMNELYSRILDSMSRAPPYGKALAKAILIWAVCSARPLTTGELYEALQIDIKDQIDDIKLSIASRCGQFVYVDTQSRVQMIHQTARDFLLSSSDFSEFGIDKSAGHRRLFVTCLRFLNGNEMRGTRRLSATNTVTERSSFVSYACNSFYDHIIHLSSQDDEVILSLGKFLSSSNVLSWIEFIAQHSDLHHLIQAGKTFQTFLQRRFKHLAPVSKDFVLIDRWATDLVRLVTKFGKNMKALPSSINHLIPPFCPPETAARGLFAGSTRGINVVGLSATTWDDCLSTIVDPREQFTALACSDKFFAIGTTSGKIIVHNEMTCQQTQTLEHPEPVKLLRFGRRLDILVSAGARRICLWDTTLWEQVWELKASQQCISLSLLEEDQLLLGALKDNNLVIWDLAEGTLRDTVDWTHDHEALQSHAFRRPIAAAFCTESRLLAVVYRGQDILIWDLDRDVLHDTYSKAGPSSSSATSHMTAGVTAGVVFSTTPDATLLVAGYSDGDLVLFDVSQGLVKEKTPADAQTLACSPDGRTLASGGSSGTIQLFEFETLKLLYRIKSDEYYIRELVFTEDSLRLLEIRGSECRVWEPPVLLRQDCDDENSDTVSVSTTPQEIVVKSSENVVSITSMVPGPKGEVFFCGNEDGSVYLYDTQSGRRSQRLISHAKGVSIISLVFDNDGNALSSLDNASRITSHRLKQGSDSWEATEILLDHRAGVAVGQILTNPGATHVLVCTAKSDTLWSLSPIYECAVIETILWEKRGPFRWATHPSNKEHLILISDTVAHLYEWQTLRRITGREGILLQGSILPELAIRSITPCFDGTALATIFGEDLRPQSKSMLLFWNASGFSIDSKTIASMPRYHSIANQIKALIGDHGRRLVFLGSDDWIYSVNPESVDNDLYSRHFFLPADWLSSNIKLMVEVTHTGDIIFVKKNEVAVIKHGLDNIEEETSSKAGKRQSLLGRESGKRPLLKLPHKSY